MKNTGSYTEVELIKSELNKIGSFFYIKNSLRFKINSINTYYSWMKYESYIEFLKRVKSDTIK